jgi:hypothetical protein
MSSISPVSLFFEPWVISRIENSTFLLLFAAQSFVTAFFAAEDGVEANIKPMFFASHNNCKMAFRILTTKLLHILFNKIINFLFIILLNKKLINNSSCKFWKITYKDGYYKVTYGKIGSKGKTIEKREPLTKILKLIQSKEEKGYKEI